ncbi:hypothetical protein KEJ32_05360 [Candidatus Bathyarchaeota archaeon]|nr:hypothetical protein [Candidatus Bathyarchaeota archaeon]
MKRLCSVQLLSALNVKLWTKAMQRYCRRHNFMRKKCEKDFKLGVIGGVWGREPEVVGTTSMIPKMLVLVTS